MKLLLTVFVFIFSFWVITQNEAFQVTRFEKYLDTIVFYSAANDLNRNHRLQVDYNKELFKRLCDAISRSEEVRLIKGVNGMWTLKNWSAQ